MSTRLHIPHKAAKSEIYSSLFPQLKNLVEGEPDFIANVSNITAALKESLGYFWIGVYMVKGDELVLGPFQGTVACTRIRKGVGVCGSAWDRNETIIVPDVDRFPGHIACSTLSRSEIVVPIRRNNTVIGVLDLDSIEWNDFDSTDLLWLEKIAELIGSLSH